MKTLLLICISMLIFCGINQQNEQTADLNIRLFVQKSRSVTPKNRIIEWNRIVFQLCGADTLTDTITVSSDQTYCTHTIDKIESSQNYTLNSWTLNRNNQSSHFGSVQIASIDPGVETTIPLTLYPTHGSIYINLAMLPDDIDSVYAGFFFATDTIDSVVSKSGLTYLSLDYIPDSTAGMLIIAGKDSAGNTLYSDTINFTFYVSKDTTLFIEFITEPAGLKLQTSIIQSGITAINGIVDGTVKLTAETGNIYCSEIMYYTNGDSDYIEIYNPGITKTISFILEIISTSTIKKKLFENVVINSHDFFVIGDSDAPPSWCDTVVVLDLPTSSRWIILRNPSDSSIMDLVSYYGSAFNWPQKKKFYSIELDSLPNDPTYNNFGKNWRESTSEIDNSGNFGTPGA